MPHQATGIDTAVDVGDGRDSLVLDPPLYTQTAWDKEREARTQELLALGWKQEYTLTMGGSDGGLLYSGDCWLAITRHGYYAAIPGRPSDPPFPTIEELMAAVIAYKLEGR